MNKLLEILGKIVFYSVIGTVCFLGGWILRARKARLTKKEAKNAEKTEKATV